MVPIMHRYGDHHKNYANKQGHDTEPPSHGFTPIPACVLLECLDALNREGRERFRLRPPQITLKESSRLRHFPVQAHRVSGEAEDGGHGKRGVRDGRQHRLRMLGGKERRRRHGVSSERYRLRVDFGTGVRLAGETARYLAVDQFQRLYLLTDIFRCHICEPKGHYGPRETFRTGTPW